MMFYFLSGQHPRAENLLTLEKIDPRKATYFQNLWYFLSENSRSKNSRKFGLFFQIEAEVKAMGQKWEFGPEKKL